MRFKSLTCINYRQYKNLHLEFPQKKSWDMHLIIASNGVGKTNILNAINWCLYGDEPHSSGFYSRSQEEISLMEKLPIYNRRAVVEAIESGNEKFSVEVTIQLEKDGTSYDISRKQEYKTSTKRQIGKDTLSCIKTDRKGNTNFPVENEIYEIIQQLLPQDIREYFYFDGEQLLTYFFKQNRENIKQSVAVIAQINILNKVISHLDKVKQEYANIIKKNSPDVSEKEKEYLHADSEVRNMLKQITVLEEQIREAEKKIYEEEQFIAGKKNLAEKFNLIKENEKNINILKQEYNKHLEELIKIVRDYLVKINLYNVNKNTSDYIRERIDNGTLQPDFCEEDIKECIETCECRLCGSHLDDLKLQKLKNMLIKIGSNVSAQKLSSIKNDVFKALDVDSFKKAKQEKFDDIANKENQIDELEKNNNEIYQKISAYDDDGIDKVNVTIEQLQKNRKLREEDLEKKGSYQEQLKNLTDKLVASKAAYEIALEASENNKDISRRLAFANDAQKIVAEIANELASTVREDIAKFTEQIFGLLIWKKDTYGKIGLDENYNIKLYHKHTMESCLGSCSAAETELLALAFTLAIHEVSGYNSFLFIDTPVGRVSDFNRENFAKVLLEISEKKQIILAFTPSEYSEEIKAVLGKDVVSSYNNLRMANDDTTEVHSNV